MILDYNFSPKRHQLSVSYIKENGQKSLMKYNMDRFKSYYETPEGRYTNWNGKKCDIKWVDRPIEFEINEFLKDLPEQDRQKLTAKFLPRLYTFDIETRFEKNEFPDPATAKFEIVAISIVNDKMDCIVLGLKDLKRPDILNKRYNDYLNTCKFYRELKIQPPTCKMITFSTEGEMLKWFLRNIVSKAAVLSGWNCVGFDWQYIVNRIKNYYPDISINMSSCDWTMTNKKFIDFRTGDYRLPIPNHTVLMDYMDLVKSFDYQIMPIKENLTLDYIASESPVGLHKIQYDGDLEDLYKNDYDKYMFYNCIDSALVMLIDKCFKTLQALEYQALYCDTKISNATSKIALTEALFFNYFYGEGIRVVPPEMKTGDRGELLGAYVREPIPGKHRFCCCNDFASLYPSVIRTCNLSIENFMGTKDDFTEEQIDQYKKDPNYFVSVAGNVYKNDKDYTFKIIQERLAKERNESKYLGKKLDAIVMTDVTHIMENEPCSTDIYPEDIQKELKNIGFNFKSGQDIKDNCKDIKEFQFQLNKEIMYLDNWQIAIKYLMNGGYGASSNVYFAWFNINLSNDITGEARNLIHLMSDHIEQYVNDNWLKMKDLHKQLGIKIKKEYNI